MNTVTIDDDFVRRVAREAEADPRSVLRRLAGLPVRGRAGSRIDAVIRKEREGATPTTADSSAA